MLWRMRRQNARKRTAQRAFSSGRFGLNVYDERLCFLYFIMFAEATFQS